MNPEEPYNFNLDRALSENMSERISGLEKYTTYDLVSAIKRQSPFFYQVMEIMEEENSLFWKLAGRFGKLLKMRSQVLNIQLKDKVDDSGIYPDNASTISSL